MLDYVFPVSSGRHRKGESVTSTLARVVPDYRRPAHHERVAALPSALMPIVGGFVAIYAFWLIMTIITKLNGLP